MRHFLKKAGKVPGELESEKTAYEPASVELIRFQYFYLMDTIRDHIEATEDLLIDEPEENHIQKIHLIKKRIVYLRKYITSLNKAVNALLNNEMSL